MPVPTVHVPLASSLPRKPCRKQVVENQAVAELPTDDLVWCEAFQFGPVVELPCRRIVDSCCYQPSPKTGLHARFWWGHSHRISTLLSCFNPSPRSIAEQRSETKFLYVSRTSRLGRQARPRRSLRRHPQTVHPRLRQRRQRLQGGRWEERVARLDRRHLPHRHRRTFSQRPRPTFNVASER